MLTSQFVRSEGEVALMACFFGAVFKWLDTRGADRLRNWLLTDVGKRCVK